jgi:hypothetical protein
MPASARRRSSASTSAVVCVVFLATMIAPIGVPPIRTGLATAS